MYFKTNFEGNDYRPLFNIEVCNGKQIEALYDTGASIAVVNVSEEIFKKFDAKLQQKDASFKGFGGTVHGDLYTVSIVIGDLIFPELPVIKIEKTNINTSFIIPASMFGEFVVTLNNPEKTIEFKNNSNQVCYHMHIGDKVYTGEVMCAEYYSELRNRIIGICGEENCNKVINLLPDITPVLDDVSLRAIVMETLRNGKIK